MADQPGWWNTRDFSAPDIEITLRRAGRDLSDIIPRDDSNNEDTAVKLK
jgi:hypothetical protein